MKKKIEKKTLFIAAILISLASGGVYYLNSGEPVELEKATIGNLSVVVTDNGIVEAEGTIRLTAKAPVEITKVHLQEGDLVNAGELILSANDTTASYDLNALEAQATAIAAQAANASTVAKNSKALFEAGAISQSEYDGAKAAAAQLNAQLASLRYSIESYRNGSGIGGIVSPISGTITELFGKEGETVGVGMDLVEISPLDKFYITLFLIPEEAAKVQVGNPVTISQEEEILSKDCIVERVSKKAKEIVSTIGISQKRVEITISIPKGTKGLLLGSNMDVDIQTGFYEGILRVPSKAVFEKEGMQYVYKAEKGIAKLTPVKIGTEGEDHTEILEGLQPGDQVIVSPGNEIKDGIMIKAQKGK